MVKSREQIRVPWWGDEVMYWFEDQVAIVFQCDVPADSPPPSREAIIGSLNLDDLDLFFRTRGFKLQPFSSKHVPHPLDRQASHSRDLHSPVGKYLFPAPDGGGMMVVGFFNIKPVKTFHPAQDPRTTMAIRGGVDAPSGWESDSNTHKIVNLINGNLDSLKQEVKVPIVAAAPNWLGGGNCYGHGCPVFPPFPVPERDFCTSARGRWPIQIPALLSDSSPLREMNGKGVTVFVLDSMPDLEHDPDLIKDVAKRAGKSNKLLAEIADQQDRVESPFIKFRYQDLPDHLKENAPDQLVTGRDLNGKMYGFTMPDHGLFIVGVIRDLACEADIEYVRVLNDFGVTSAAVVIEALENIHARMARIDPRTGKEGDLYNKPVVINLSLVIGPPEEELLQAWFGVDPSHKTGEQGHMNYDSSSLRSHLHQVIQCLTASGAVIVASAGNDSHMPEMPDWAKARYPAAFQEVIAVGAVDKDGNAAMYSSLPSHYNGVATYGGSIPTLEAIKTDTSIDAMHGVFSDKLYPALVATNPPQPDYDPHNPTAWAYWSGTSFAAPIISSVAARVLQLKSGEWSSDMWVPGVHRAILTPEGQQELLTGDHPLPIQSKFGVGLLMAYQCKERMMDTIVVQWNDAALQAVRDTHPGPPMVARAMAILNTCLYEAWAAYDAVAVGTRLSNLLRRPASESTLANKTEAISYAAYRALVDLFPSEVTHFNNVMASLGYDPNDTSSGTSTPSGIGNLAARVVMDFRHADGSNQLGDLHPGAYSDYTGYVPVNDPDHVNDPNHWQPLRVSDGHGGFVVQTYIAPHWGLVSPFALTSGSQFRPEDGPELYSSDGYQEQVQQILDYSANLTDKQKVIAEYWADGPSSELPPGHWCLFARFVSQRDTHDLDDDVKLFFTLTSAIFDASIACWDAKRTFDYVRPVTAVHYALGDKRVRAWAGPYQGTKEIRAADWQPYQPVTVVTPPFPEFFSGHSTFSAAGAEILKRFTGSDDFGGSFTQAAGTSRVEPGATPATDVTLSWDTFSDAADQAGISRRYGGIHFEQGDLVGREVGRAVAAQAWDKAQSYITGTGT